MATLPAPPPEPDVSALPEYVHAVVTQAIKDVRKQFESGEQVGTKVFLLNQTDQTNIEVKVDVSSGRAKDQSVAHIRTVAAMCEADLMLFVADAWTLKTSKLGDYDRVIAKYGSIGASPYAISAVSLLVETHDGFWMAMAPLQKVPKTRNGQTFGNVKFTEAQAGFSRFGNILPPKKSPKSFHFAHE